jgi:hypothetical protein
MYLLALFVIFSALNPNLCAGDENSTANDTVSLNSIDPQTANFTQIYDQYLTRIQNRRLSGRELEELYGNKSKFAIVTFFAPLLIDEASKQIGLNELRRHFFLKSQQISFTDLITEEQLDDNRKFDPKILSHFQQMIRRYSKNLYSNSYFYYQDVNFAEVFVDRKFPEIRELFRLKYEEKYANKELSDNQIVDKAFFDFSRMRAKIYKAVENCTRESYDELYWKIS